MKTLIFLTTTLLSCLSAFATSNPTPEARAPPGTAEVFSAFNPTVVDHVYSTNASEIQLLLDFYGYNTSERTQTGLVHRAAAPATVPLYRLYSVGAADHMYTTDAAVRDRAVRRLGYHVEGVLGYVYTEEGPGRLPLFSLYNPARVDHYYTTSAEQRDDAAKNGWDVLGGAGFLLAL